jgi:hypothetical protein
MALGILVQADEEIEIKQMRKQQVPRAHPMPDFSKPFVPKRYRISSPCASSMMICQHFFRTINRSVSAPNKVCFKLFSSKALFYVKMQVSEASYSFQGAKVSAQVALVAESK